MILTLVSLAAIVSISAFALISGPKPASPAQGQWPYKPKFFHVVIGGNDLYIADGYVSQTFSSIGRGEDSALIHAYYPGDVPILKSTDQLWEEGRYTNVLSILLRDQNVYGNFRPNFHPHNLVLSMMKTKKTDKANGQQFGLQHYTQSDEKWSHLDDVWIEHDGGLQTSFIACSDDSPVPQCQHYFYDDRYSYKVRFNRNFLPEWRRIKASVLDLVTSFRSPDAARAFVTLRIPSAYQQQLKNKEIPNAH